MSHRKRRRLWFGGCLVALVLVVAVPFAALWYITSTYDDGTEALRAKGYPTTVEELETWYPAPQFGENTADYYIEAGARLKASEFDDIDWLPLFGEARLPPLGMPMSEDVNSTIAAFLDHEAAAFELIDEAAEFDTGRYPQDIIAASAAMLDVMEAMKGQWLRTLYYNDLGDADAAIDQFGALVHLARARSQEPSFDSLFLVNWTADQSMDTAERILNTNKLSDEQLARLDNHLSTLIVDEHVLHALIRDRCIFIERMRSSPPPRIPFVYDFMMGNYTRLTNEYIAIAEDGLPDRLQEYRELADREYSVFDIYAGIFEGPIRGTVRWHYTTEARVSLVRLAIAIQQARNAGLELGNESPIEAVDNWPSDPWSGAPMQYKRVGDGFIVYSAGINYQDDGGQRDQGLDTVFRVLQ